jgi:hypothetical protein
VRPLFLAIVVAIGLPLAVRPGIAAACDCDAPLTEEEALERADVAFVGAVVGESVMADDGVTVYTFAVSEGLKNVETPTVDVLSDVDSDCGMTFRPGERYHVFADEVDGSLVTSICAGNAATGVAVERPERVIFVPPDLEPPPERVFAEPGVAPPPILVEPRPANGLDIGPLLVMGAVVLVLAVVSAWAFGRRPGRPPSA